MPEHQTSRPNQDPAYTRPVVTPEQHRLFSSAYAKLMRFAAAELDPHMAVGLQYRKTDPIVGHWAEKSIENHNASPYKSSTQDVEFIPNSRGGEVHIDDEPGWLFVNDEGAAQKMGNLGSLTIYGDDGNQDIYDFHFDGNIEHERYGYFGNTDEFGYVDETIPAGWLSPDEIKELSERIERLKPGWDDASMPTLPG